MSAHVRANLMLLALTLSVGAVLYPLAVLAVGRGLFPTAASGSLVEGPDGEPVGSRLVAQKFEGERFFWPRPSAANYDASASAGSNLAASNPKLRERVEEALKSRAERPVAADAVTASGSGLDPHVTLANARGQTGRVVRAWAKQTGADEGRVRAAVEEILPERQFRPLGGAVGGEPLVNVLEVNLDLARRLSR